MFLALVGAGYGLVLAVLSIACAGVGHGTYIPAGVSSAPIGAVWVLASISRRSADGATDECGARAIRGAGSLGWYGLARRTRIQSKRALLVSGRSHLSLRSWHGPPGHRAVRWVVLRGPAESSHAVDSSDMVDAVPGRPGRDVGSVREHEMRAPSNNGMQLTKAARCAPFTFRSWGRSLRAAIAADPGCSTHVRVAGLGW